MQKSNTPVSISAIYADANAMQPREYWDYDNFSPSWCSPNNYEVVRRLGRGKYSEVFEAVDVTCNRACVVKILKPIKKKKIRREVLVLTNLKGGPNIVELYDTVVDPQSRTNSLVFEFVNAPDFKIFYPSLSDKDIRFYMFQLLVGLDYAHSRGIMHRDIKPHNVGIDPQTRNLRILDWGLSEFYHPGTEYHVRVASRHFKGPELLLNMKEYDYSLDLWSFACMFAGMIFLVHPFLHGRDNYDQVTKIAKVTGSKEIHSYIKKYRIVDIDEPTQRAIGNFPARSLDKFVTSGNQHLAVPEALDLLSKVLVVDHALRLTAKQCLLHPYFDPVREAALEHVKTQQQDRHLAAEQRQASHLHNVPAASAEDGAAAATAAAGTTATAEVQ